MKRKSPLKQVQGIGIKEQAADEIINAMPDPLIVLDLNGVIVSVNPAYTRTFGWKPEDRIGKSFTELKSLKAEDIERFTKLRGKLVEISKTGLVETVIRTKDGTEIPISVAYSLIKDNEGNSKNIIAVLRDITETKNLINEVKEARDKLEEHAKERTAELEDSYKELQATQAQLIQSEKLAFAGRMAASVAHEIRNPLSIMTIAMQSFQRELGPDFSGKEHIEMVMRNIKRIGGLIDEFVDVARPPKLKMKPQDMHRVLDNFIRSTKGKFEASNIEVIKDFDSRLPRIMLDKEHLERAFLNIVFNAIDAMPEGGKFTISTTNEENYVIVKFIDTGVGISDSDIINIFDPFFSNKKGGAGLGLSIALGIIHSHGGTIEVKSTKGEGSTFIVRLPIREYKGRSK